MSAMLKARGVRLPKTQWGDLEPVGLGHDLLIAWAPWVREDRDREKSHAWAEGVRLDREHPGEPPDSVNRTDKIVARIRLEHAQYYRVIARVYLGERSYADAARDLGYTQGWLRTMVLAACGLVEMRYRDGA